MTGEPRWISKKALLMLHEESLATFGGASGLRDEGLLDSALARPLNTPAYNADSTLADLAASCAFGLAKNHAFVDGNKRATFLSIGMFLSINGHKLAADQVDAIQTMLAVAAGELDEQGLSPGFRRTSSPGNFATHHEHHVPLANDTPGEEQPLARAGGSEGAWYRDSNSPEVMNEDVSVHQH